MQVLFTYATPHKKSKLFHRTCCGRLNRYTIDNITVILSLVSCTALPTNTYPTPHDFQCSKWHRGGFV